ncbi:MAG: response regulator [Desulfobacterales bacterium]|uniref:Response regulator n=1 Tax=Candidatus Desulfatibia vada TaxID=2841696 RepID=A0A8J6NT47_9BACT|nr:response regulator [Candidatus Desulfatibia vada]MBL6970714.1 response regulator [Desulfobacterales bacterium]
MKIRVLLVDDEKDFVESLSQRLQIREFDVKTSLSGDDALELIRKRDIDVVVLDVLMPGKGGIETLREIKDLQPLLQVIMLTGNTTVETAIEGMKLGAYDYLMKPTETEDLVDKITKAHTLKTEHEERISKAEIKNTIKRRYW